MKVEIKEKETKKEKGFPKLMVINQGKEKGLIILFERYASGQALNNAGIYFCGYASNHWDMDLFKDFEGSITLSND